MAFARTQTELKPKLKFCPFPSVKFISCQNYVSLFEYIFLSTVCILPIVIASGWGQTTNYCDRALCPSGGPHIACNGLGSPSPACGAGSFEIKLDSSKQALIVNRHNQLRNRVAMGNQNYTDDSFYPPAARMATLVWDRELAYMAAANARRCVYEHDRCRNTMMMRTVGQSMAIKVIQEENVPDEMLIREFIDSWFSEYSNSNPSHISSYPLNWTGPTIRHFTQMMSDRSSRIGCAMMSFGKSPWINKLFVCNYGFTNTIKQPVYVTGPPGSQCLLGRNPDFPGLCRTVKIVVKYPSFIISLVVNGSLGQTADFCNASLCRSGVTHIACHGLQNLSSTCGDGSFEVNLDSAKQALITNQHNTLRSRVALGNQNYTSTLFYPQAAKMATLAWDNELAHIAATNARRCVFGHDQCRNTATMRYVGQNIAIKMFYGMSITDEVLIKGFIDSWFSEYANSNPSHIASYPSAWTGPTIGHFTQVVSDRSSKIGCAMVSYITAPWINKLFVCNYGLTNIVGQPVYVAGATGSQCKTGRNPSFSGLCSTSEVVSNNP
ncbi:uncharacterized protein LOC134210495 [Armigeres subalbatus]|uniref:uncharacterized protein LOC134210495 n=1 Tax=Armigeres subalbatus TaxID=124917 RepID=UPI002ED376A2